MTVEPVSGQSERTSKARQHPIAQKAPTTWCGADVWLLGATGIVALMLILWFWILPLRNSYWLDETLVVALLHGPFWDVIKNTADYSQSPLFSALEWVIVRLTGGTSEIALRSVSVLAAFGSLWLWYRIGRDIYDREFGLILSALYITLPQVAIQVPNARPYSLALLAESAGLLFFLRWLKCYRTRDGVMWIICTICAVHFQYLFMTAFATELLFAFLDKKCFTLRGCRELLKLSVLALILLVPAVPQFLTLFANRQVLSYADPPGFLNFILQVIPVVFLLVAPVVALACLGEHWSPYKAIPTGIKLGCCLLLIPSLALFSISHVSGVVLFIPRYLLPITPGILLFWGGFLHSIQKDATRRVFLLLVMILSVPVFLGPNLDLTPGLYREDWRSAVSAAPEHCGIILYTGLVEARRRDWITDSDHWKYMSGPIQAYRRYVRQKDILILPFTPDASDTRYVDIELKRFVQTHSTVSLIEVSYEHRPTWNGVITDLLAKVGYRKISLYRFDLLSTTVFSKN